MMASRRRRIPSTSDAEMLLLNGVTDTALDAPGLDWRSHVGLHDDDDDGDDAQELDRPQRRSTTFRDDNERFRIPKTEFSKQYASIYFMRLSLLRPHVVERARRDCPDVDVVDSSLQLEQGKECVLVGTLYKDMKLKPCVLDEYLDDDVNVEPIVNFVSTSDTLSLEDCSGRVLLNGVGSVLSVEHLVTGLVIGVRGHLTATGTFEVVQLIEPAVAPQKALPEPHKDNDDDLIVLVSGLNIGDASMNPVLSQHFADYISGCVGSDLDASMSSRISGVFLCGNSLCASTAVGKRYALESGESARAASLRALDLLLEQMCASVDVHLMPGEQDPATYALPQQPLHPFLLPRASSMSTLNACTNPCKTVVNDAIDVVGCAGQNVDDVMRMSKLATPLDALQELLRWRLLAPTCPDTLSCCPFQDVEPFVLDVTPHIFFAANQTAFASRLVRHDDGVVTRLVCVPSFAHTGTVVVVNLRSLECEAISIDAR